ncbi:hypothetical protein [Carboxylicivirga linearis]|uniref:Uncharacterized protein n=1 Tax=Carboxylicivirga linearis TaxID=1628157 RepID=A0ABS5JZE6_9BACT|nr:hypothetical protein [Carboxylicivirga linearis]MBS2100275.1 hypothetical protein [Carboxylicivirga linearis]
MKYLIITLVASMMTLVVYSQDFSYVKEIELNDINQLNSAEEDVLECCYYLVAARYNKNDNQRIIATDFVNKWAKGRFGDEAILNTKVKEVTEERQELNDLFVTYYTLRFIENEGDMEEEELMQAAFTGVISFCENPVNKIKLTKELKGLKQVIEDGALSAYLQE